MASMKVVVYVKIVNIIPKVSTVINVNRNIIVHMENIGMKPMCANVSFFFHSFIIFLNLNELFERKKKYVSVILYQVVIVTILAQLEIVKKKLDVVNVDQNIKNQTVYHAHMVISVIQIVDHVNVTLMAQKVTFVNHPMVNVHVNQTLLVITVNDVRMVTMDLNVYHVIAIQRVQ